VKASSIEEVRNGKLPENYTFSVCSCQGRRFEKATTRDARCTANGGFAMLRPMSIRLLYKNEGRAGHDRGAGADKGDVGVLDLARAGAA
jgi:hypothetical protein